MDKDTALFATVLTGLTMSLSKDEEKTVKEERKLTIPEIELHDEEFPASTLAAIALACLMSFGTAHYVGGMYGLDTGLYVLVLLGSFSLYFYIFDKIKSLLSSKTKPVINEDLPKMVVPARYVYLESSIHAQTSKNLPNNFYYQHSGSDGEIVCYLEEYLCAIGKELVFDKTNLEIRKEDSELIGKLKKLKEDCARAKSKGDTEGYKRGVEILIRWLSPYQFESKDDKAYFTDINDIPENDIITFSRATLEMLFHWQKIVMYYQYRCYYASLSRYDSEYYFFRKLVVEDNVFGLVDIISSLYSFYHSLGAPRIIQIEDPCIYNRPRRLAITETRTSFLFNPEYLEECNY